MPYNSILIIDDDTEDIEIFMTALSDIDPQIECLTQNDSLEALQKLQVGEYSPDIIFLDFNMPKYSGKEFLASVREIPSAQDIPIVIYSGYSMSEIEQLTLQNKKLHFLAKPNTYGEIVTSVKNIVQGKFY